MTTKAERRPGGGGVPETRAGGGIGNSVRDPLQLAQAVAELLEHSDERDAWLARLGDEYQLGWKLGYAAGRAAERLEADREWAAVPPQRIRGGDALADVEARRWELRGEIRTRETFGRPHPADHRGQRRESAA